jgi:hypothetical protein
MQETTGNIRGVQQMVAAARSDEATRPESEAMSPAAAQDGPAALTVEDMQKVVMTSLKNKRGILDGRDLYRVYRESDQPKLRLAIQGLEKSNLVSVKGDLEAPLGVFQSVLVERG